MSLRIQLFAFSLIAVLTGILALFDGHLATLYGCFCVTFWVVMIDLCDRPTPTVHDRVRARRAKRRV